MCDLSIIIVNWNTRALLADCLATLAAGGAEVAFETIVVDNASTDGSVEAVRARFPAVRVIANAENAGFARANNQGLRLAAGRYLLLLNSDTRVWPGALKRMVDFLETHPRAGVVGAELRNVDGSLQPSWAAFPSLLSEVSGRNFRVRRAYPEASAFQVDWVGGACLMVRREVVDQVGLLDEAIFMYTEETDWCYRIARHQWEIGYLPGACVTHLGGGSSRNSSLRSLLALYSSKIYFFRKHYGRGMAVALKTALLVRTTVQILVLSLPWPRAADKRERLGRFQSLWRVLAEA